MVWLKIRFLYYIFKLKKDLRLYVVLKAGFALPRDFRYFVFCECSINFPSFSNYIFAIKKNLLYC